ncbi:uncharacterized protein LOC126263975 isoform X1 [Schistocerca nitens]|uniref:uncharacterized protein LOC126263975 isoform X1 n=1 Tax=Schistocerca nitens TaxID=7011 RepID=UPI0021177E49|nr:uncharacterized protein LOC126263975 isoform X1 [Schistocerca nitens]
MAPTGGRMQSVILCFSFLMVFLQCSAYRKYSLGHDKVCSHVKKQTIKLPPENGILITEQRTFDKWSGYKEFRCKFKVELLDEGDLFAVIQNVTFRKDPVTGECIDYVQLTGDDKRMKTEKICGTVNAIKRLYGNAVQSYSDTVPIAFVDSDGEISVEVYVANEPLSSNSEELTFSLAFTRSVPCSSRNAFVCAEDKCIPEEFKSDSIVNCPYGSCLDEHCTFGGYDDDGPKVPKSGLGTKVVLGAVATVLLAFVLFLVIIWVLRRCHKACWSAPHQRVPVSAAESGALAEHLSYNRGSSPLGRTSSSSGHAQSQFPPTSVMVESVATLPPSAPPPHLAADKDLPPSYESLFPSR